MSAQLRLLWLECRDVPTAYFVAVGGDDNAAGDLSHPFAHVQHAIDLALPNDSISVRAGTYSEQVTFTHGGNAKQGPILLQAFTGEHPILSGAGIASGDVVAIQSCGYITISGFEITGLTNANDGSGIRITGGAPHIQILDNHIHDITGTSAMGITVYGTSAVPVSDLVIDGNEVDHVDAAPSESLTLNGNVVRFAVTNNLVHDNNNIGIDVIRGERDINPAFGARNGLVQGNTVWNCHANYGGGFAAGIYLDGAKNVTVNANVSHDNDMGLEVGAENAGIVASGDVIENNVLYDNTQAGLVFGGYQASVGRVRGCRFINNTVVGNDTTGTGFGQLWIQFGSGNVIANNIFVAEATETLIHMDETGNADTLNDNLYFSAGTPTFVWGSTTYTSLGGFQDATRKDRQSVASDPLFADQAGHDYHLATGTPAVDVAVPRRTWFATTDFDGVARPVNGVVNMGAFERPN
jgi:hypothetical protein